MQSMDPKDEHRYSRLSPFELKHQLVRLARHRDERLMLNAARGNPNWLALEAREGFFQLGRFALEESARTALAEGLGGAPKRVDIGKRFRRWLSHRKAEKGSEFLGDCLNGAVNDLALSDDELVHEWVDGILGGHYPTPGRFLRCCEKIVHRALEKEVLRGASVGRFDLFATEGATAAIRYLFDSLSHSGLLERGDVIALGVPIFTPYSEVPRLRDYDLVEVGIRQDEQGGWQYPEPELEKLLDPRVKVFLLVNPSNPTSVAIHPEAAIRIATLVKTKRPDLILISDDVYATFAPTYVCMAALVPENTILIYSWSKAWGTTGWRLGVVAIHEQTILDALLSRMSSERKAEVRARYETVSTDPVRMRFIDRMLADSRAVGLNHTAGLSTPQQVQMALLCMQALVDDAEDYHGKVRTLLRSRHRALCIGAEIAFVEDPCCAHYYVTLDVPEMARERHGEIFSRWLVDSHEPVDFVIRLAQEKGVVLMDGGGFEAPRMSVRISLANLPDEGCERVGQAIVELIDDYYRAWLSVVC